MIDKWLSMQISRREIYMKKTDSKVIWGILFVLFGLGIGAYQLGLLEGVSLFFPGWWTLFIIIPCFVQLISGKGRQSSFIWLSVGILLLLYMQGMFTIQDFGGLVVAILCIIIGVSFFFKDDSKRIYREQEKRERRNKAYEEKLERDREKRDREYQDKSYYKENNSKEPFTEYSNSQVQMVRTETNEKHRSNNRANESNNHYVTYFSSNNIKYVDEIFQKASVVSVLGNIQLDLRNAIFEGDGVLEVTCILGGIDIYVPSNIRVVNHCTTILAGVENTVMAARDTAVHTFTLYVKGNCILGGIEIK